MNRFLYPADSAQRPLKILMEATTHIRTDPKRLNKKIDTKDKPTEN